MNITLRRLEILLAISETGSFAAAADRFGIAQPSVSSHVKALERSLGGPIFERRRGRSPLLTDLGRRVVDYAREMVSEAADLRADIVNINTDEGQRVVFSCQRSLANFGLAESLTDFALRHRDIHLLIRVGTQENAVADLREGVADVACFLQEAEIRGLEAEVLGKQNLAIVCAPDHPLARWKQVSPSTLSQQVFVGPPPSSVFSRMVAKRLADAGVQGFKVAAQATEFQFLRQLIISGLGIACVPEMSVADDLATGHLHRIRLDAPPLQLDICQAVSTRRPRTEAVDTFVSFLHDCRLGAESGTSQ